MRYKLDTNLQMDTVEGELVVLNPARGVFHYYTASTEKFLRLFEKPVGVQDLVESETVPTTELSALSEFVTHLITSGILVPDPNASRSELPEYRYERPVYLSDKKQRPDDFAFLNPIGGSGH